MKKNFIFVVALLLLVVLRIESSYAGAPFNNLEGVGGVAFNPLAYLGGESSVNPEDKADENPSDIKRFTKYIGNPRFGTWYVNLGDVNVNWFSFGVSDTLFDRLEVSYGYEAISQKNAADHTKNNIGTKLLLLPENLFNTKFLPAISIGGIYKHTDNVVAGARRDGWDGYIVASKTITQLPLPVILSAGGLLTSSYATGVFGYNKRSKPTWFANADVLLTENIVAGAEYKQGAQFKEFKNADYLDAHVGWLVNKNLSLIAAYTYTGDQKSTKKVGLGNGFVISAQYSF